MCRGRLRFKKARVYNKSVYVMSAPYTNRGVFSAQSACKAKELTETCMTTTC